MVSNKNKHNWTLYCLFFLSVFIHLILLGYMNGRITPKVFSRIELTISDMAKPIKRNIPKPPQQTKPPSPIHSLKKTSVNKSITSVPLSKKTEPAECRHINFEKQIKLPADPVHPRIYEWKAANKNTAADDYLAIVRIKIEQHKKYPPLARIKQNEGRVVVRFVITLEGRAKKIQVIKSSGYKSLDEAALKAIKTAAPFPKPPSHLFKRTIPIELPIIFKLT